HRFLVSVPDRGAGNVIDDGIVEEGAVAPVAALVIVAGVAEAIAYTAIESDLRGPISFVEDVRTVVIGPIGGRPQQTDRRRKHPGAWHPVPAAVSTPCPIAGDPNVSRGGNRRLIVNRQRRRREVYRNSDGGL